MHQTTTSRRAWLLIAAVCLPVLLWALAIILLEPVRFSVLSSRSQLGEEGASACARLFGALVLLLFPDDATRSRLRRVAAGLVVLGVGGLAFGTLPPLFGIDPGLARTMYASLMVSSVASLLFVLGFLPTMTQAWTVKVVAAAVVVACAVIAAADRLPSLADPVRFAAAVGVDDPPLDALSPWYWLLSVILVLLSVGAMWAGAVRFARDGWGAWLVVSMALFAGSQLHNAFWPSAYTPTLTSANLLRLAFAGSVAIGGVLELRRVASERAARLTDAREHASRLAELAVIKADFTAMAAHELAGPVVSVRRSAELLAATHPRSDQTPYLGTILSEVDHLVKLIADVGTSATVERDDFVIEPHPIPVKTLLDEAAAFAKALGDEHQIVVEDSCDVLVVADDDRIGQVVRNLLTNAVRYSPPGTTIVVRARCSDGRVVFDVHDTGDGIHPDDLTRIFDKFARGRSTRRTGGLGLGLYLSRRIIQAHGGDLTAISAPGEGTTMTFSLEIAQ